MLKQQILELLDWRLPLRILNWRLLAIGTAAYWLNDLPTREWGTEQDNLRLMIELFTLASLAMSWNILAGFVGHINLGHVAFFGIGSAVTRELWLTKEYPFYHAFFLGGGAAALAALIIGIPALRLKGTYFAIGTLALAEAVRVTVQSRLPGQSTLPPAMLRTFRLEYVQRYELSLYVLVATVLVAYVLSRSRVGLAMRAIREDEDAARSIGINVFLHSIFALVLSAYLAGLAGGAFAYSFYSYQHSLAFEPRWTFDALLVTFVGGPGTLVGPLIGSGFFIYTQDYLSSASELANTVPIFVAILLIIFPLTWIFNAVLVTFPGGSGTLAGPFIGLGYLLYRDPSGSVELVGTHPIFFGVLFIIVVLTMPGGMVDLATRIIRFMIRWAQRLLEVVKALNHFDGIKKSIE